MGGLQVGGDLGGFDGGAVCGVQGVGGGWVITSVENRASGW